MDTSILHPELKFRSSRSSGSGGQHVNKVETKVELLFDLEASSLLNEAQKGLIREKLASRISKEGILSVSSQASRSQQANKEAAVKKFDRLIGEALQPRKVRKPTRPPKAVQEARLREKKMRSEIKALRRGE